MRDIGIITNRDKDQGLKITRELVEVVEGYGGNVRLPSDIAGEIGFNGEKLDEKEVLSRSDVIISLGGDGTFLKVARKAYRVGVPMLGINLGSLGFLTEIEKSDIKSAVECLLQDKYTVEERMMLEARIIRDQKAIATDIALNDVVISRVALSRILHLRTYFNNVFADSFPGDGLIISSPTGSTAYSLSAGGPIVEPDADLMIITPICPHILYSRSFITTGSSTVKVVVEENYSQDAMVTVDGQKGYEVKGGDAIEVSKAPHSVKMVRISSRNFFNVLRTKIYDRGEGLRKDEI